MLGRAKVNPKVNIEAIIIWILSLGLIIQQMGYCSYLGHWGYCTINNKGITWVISLGLTI